MQLDEWVRVKPMATWTMLAVDDHDVGVAGVDQGISESHSKRTGAHHEVVGLYDRTIAHRAGILGLRAGPGQGQGGHEDTLPVSQYNTATWHSFWTATTCSARRLPTSLLRMSST